MANNTNFFESPQAAAVYKHKLLKGYIPAWAGKVGSTSTGKRVVVYDAYSGPGRYANEEPGSPELLVDTAQALAGLRSVFSVFTEKEAGYCDRLSDLMKEKGVDPGSHEIRQGPMEEHLDDVLKIAGNDPLFMFLDPFGLTAPLETVVHVLSSRDKAGYPRYAQPKTELLMNFSYEAVRRIAGALMSEKDYGAKAAQIQALNSRLGGDWWHEVARSGDADWVDQVLEGFATRVATSAGYGFITASVADSLDAKPVYELILFTRHPDGLWVMADSMSKARKAWREWLAEAELTKSGGQLEFTLRFEDDEEGWIHEIAKNIKGVLATDSAFVIENKLGEVLGRTLGLARETHIRKALRILVAQQAISEVPKGKLQKAAIRRA
jgi:three-Cys-motif partner protein